MIPFVEATPEDLLGPLNEVEKKFAPKHLFYQGDPALAEKAPRVSIVGSRDASSEGLARARKLAKLVVAHEGVVISGLAKGIDKAAHTSAIEHGGRTIGVIGTPLDRSYPKENSDLQKLIAEEHLCISQFPIGYKTFPACFPMRNRTMALLSHATVIIEAGETSGSISQGWEALRLGRGLFISQSLFDNPRLKWPDEMARYGALAISNDSIEEFFESMPNWSPCLETHEFAI